LVALLAITAPLAIAGCGAASSNGVAAKSPDAIVAAAKNAISGVKSVHVSGSVVASGVPVTLDLNLAAGEGGSGRMSQNGRSFQVVVVKRVVYVKGSDAFWRHFGGQAAVQLLHGKWFRGPATGEFAALAAFVTEPKNLFKELSSGHVALAKGGTSTVDGQKVIAVKDTSKGGTLYVATTGKPYPIKIAKTGSQNSGQVTFDRYNEPVSLTPPANSIDLSKLP
jgi:hypothetical protein